MSRDNITRCSWHLLLLVAGVWVVTATKWADVEVERPPHGEAAKNPLYATQSLLRRLGAEVTQRQDLDAMPPAQTQLVLVSRHWDLFPERAERLRNWVEQGGHLVIPGFMATHSEFEDWLPIVEATEPVKPSGLSKGTGSLPLPRRAASQKDKDCREIWPSPP